MNNARQFTCDLAGHLTMPAVYLMLRDVMLNPGSSIPDYVKVITQDAMLTTRVINIANSQFFGFGRKIKTLNQAINLIGVKQLHDLFLSYLCIRAFNAIPQTMMNMAEFWRHSIHCGIAAKIIADYSSLPSSYLFFTLGMLHDIGHPAMYVKAPDACIQVLQDHREQKGSIAELEKEALGFDYCQVGAEIVKLWHLPEIYAQVAAHHLRPQYADSAYWEAVTVVHLAYVLCQHLDTRMQHILINSIRVNNTHFSMLPDNIETIVQQSIEAHENEVLSLLLSGEYEASSEWGGIKTSHRLSANG
ncbi:MAG: HD-like signal output (HDOD) protein [Pseudohongiellaceae bacterium]|jgi:HD-like signal output (HDOD) protein